MSATPPPVPGAGARGASLGRYLLGVAITVVAILSQYFVPQTWTPARALYDNLPGDLFVVYGVPVIAFSLLVGAGPLRHWAGRMGTAAVQGLRWYGALSLLALVITLGLIFVYEAFDLAALQLLDRPNPALTQAAGNPWFWIGFSFVVGAFEETIFRGWIFGYWQHRRAGWLGPAVGSSALFAGIHLYYGTTYGLAAPLIFPSLFLIGFAFAATYRASGGNLVVVALLHGAYDAAAFYYAFINPTGGLLFRYVPILVGGIIALVFYLETTDGARLGPI
ncbi:MAG: CPBP family intramembrane metalloprotease [Thermoplasmata archaeon]|nr:CPBP family intramembrane metalloprotease [Thermoplasmata archaeon]